MHTTKHRAELNTKFYDYISRTPIINTKLGTKLVSIDLKNETMQESGSFKDRGALNAILSLYQVDPDRLHSDGVVAASAGNHGQGVARAAKIVGAGATVFVPESTPQSKLHAMKAYAANVIKVPGDVDCALLAALDFSNTTSAHFIHPFDDPAVMIGQGSIATEIVEEKGLSFYDRIYVPVGGGGLVAGIASALHEHGSKTEVIGVQLEGSDSFAQSLVEGRVVELKTVNSLSDGTAVRMAGKLTVQTALQLTNLNRVITVSEAELGGAMDIQDQSVGVIAEPAGALALAGMILERDDCQHMAHERWLGIVSGNHRDEGRYSMLKTAALAACGKVV